MGFGSTPATLTRGQLERVGSMRDMILEKKRICFGVASQRGTKRARDVHKTDGANKLANRLVWRGGGGEDCVAIELGCTEDPDTPRALKAFAQHHGNGVAASTPDLAFFGVFDGHHAPRSGEERKGGNKCAKWISENTYSRILEHLRELEPVARGGAAASNTKLPHGAPGDDPWLLPTVWRGASQAITDAVLAADKEVSFYLFRCSI